MLRKRVWAPAGMQNYNWISKSNAMSGLVQSCATATPSACQATFSGKNTIKAVDRSTSAAYCLGGNYTFQVDVTDVSKPGSSPKAGPDSYAIPVWDSASGAY